MAQLDRRSLTYERCADGSIAMRIVLPPEASADVVRCLEHHEELLFANTSEKNDEAPRPSAPQRRADALLAIAHASIDVSSGKQATGCSASATADRHLVVTHVDVETLMAAERQVAAEPVDSDAPLPSPLRAAIAGVLGGSISPATARRLACEGSLVTMIVKNGEPIAVGRTCARSFRVSTGCTPPHSAGPSLRARNRRAQARRWLHLPRMRQHPVPGCTPHHPVARWGRDLGKSGDHVVQRVPRESALRRLAYHPNAGR